MDHILDIMWAAFRDAIRGERYDEAKIIQDGIWRLKDELPTMPTAQLPVVRQEESAA